MSLFVPISEASELSYTHMIFLIKDETWTLFSEVMGYYYFFTPTILTNQSIQDDSAYSLGARSTASELKHR